MLEYFVWASWFLLGTYTSWFLTRVKKAEPVTLDEVVILWKIHRLETGCNCPLSEVEPIADLYSKEISGFKCACGYSYMSKHLLAQRRASKFNMFAVPLDTREKTKSA